MAYLVTSMEDFKIYKAIQINADKITLRRKANF